MSAIYMLLKILSAGIGISVPVLILRVFHMKNIAHTCGLHLEGSSPSLLMDGSAYTIM